MKSYYNAKTDTYCDELGNLLYTSEQLYQQKLDAYNLDIQNKKMKDWLDKKLEFYRHE